MEMYIAYDQSVMNFAAGDRAGCMDCIPPCQLIFYGLAAAGTYAR